VLCFIFVLQKFQIIQQLVFKKERFDLYAKGRTKMEILFFDHDILHNFGVFFKSIGRVFYFSNLDPLLPLDFLVIVSNVLILSLLLFALFFQTIRSKFVYHLIIFLCVSVFFVIGFYVPNYGAIIRYRSVFVMLLLWGIVVSISPKGLQYILRLRNLSYNLFNRLRFR